MSARRNYDDGPPQVQGWDGMSGEMADALELWRALDAPAAA
jgi:hypothetical protein